MLIYKVIDTKNSYTSALAKNGNKKSLNSNIKIKTKQYIK